MTPDKQQKAKKEKAAVSLPFFVDGEWIHEQNDVTRHYTNVLSEIDDDNFPAEIEEVRVRRIAELKSEGWTEEDRRFLAEKRLNDEDLVSLIIPPCLNTELCPFTVALYFRDTADGLIMAGIEACSTPCTISESAPSSDLDEPVR